MLSVEEARSLMGKKVSRGALYAAIRRGELPVARVGRRILFNRARLLAYLNGVTK